MLRFVLLQNRAGKTRLSKYYNKFSDEETRKIEAEVHRIVTQREGANASSMCSFVEWRNYKLVYRRYAGLFFTMCIDPVDNELSYLEIIHLFVECLDRYFGNVCELDLVYNFHKVYMILDEFFLSGEVQETSKAVIMERLHVMDEARGGDN